MAETDVPLPQFQQLGDSEWAAIHPDGGWFISNAGFIEGSDGLLVVDTFVSERRTRALLDGIAARRRDPSTPTTLLLTHEHGDHVNGASVFEDAGARLLASPHTVQSLSNHGIQTFPGYLAPPDWGDIRPPQHVDEITDRRHLDLGGTAAEIMPMAGHTTGDLVAWCPQTRCLFAGDVVFNGVTPLAISGSVTAWLRSLDEIEALDARTIVPGHGPVCGPDAVAGMRDYFHWCQRAAEQLVAGTPMQAALADRDPAWVHWPYRERDIPNVLRAAADLTEQPFDFLAALQAMVADMGHLIHAPT